eukprot:COSAG02_NODE_363_length_23785_cov_21.830828_10_plen_160_part_00
MNLRCQPWIPARLDGSFSIIPCRKVPLLTMHGRHSDCPRAPSSAAMWSAATADASTPSTFASSRSLRKCDDSERQNGYKQRQSTTTYARFVLGAILAISCAKAAAVPSAAGPSCFHSVEVASTILLSSVPCPRSIPPPLLPAVGRSVVANSPPAAVRTV